MERLKEILKSDSRTGSLSSSLRLFEDSSYDNVDPDKLYESVLKVLILEYRNEARFRTPLAPKSLLMLLLSLPLLGQGLLHLGLQLLHLGTRDSHSHQDLNAEAVLPPSIVTLLEKHLNLIALKKEGSLLDELTRRSLLRLYTELLDPSFKSEARRNMKPEYLVMKFVASANKELLKMGTSPNEVPSIAFKQTGLFVQILIKLVSKEKNSYVLIKKLNECKDSMNPSSSKAPSSSSSSSSLKTSKSSTSVGYPSNGVKVEYRQPTFRVSDMDASMITIVSDIFEVDSIKIQQDIIRLKDISLEVTLEKDIKQVQFFLGKDLGLFTQNSFVDPAVYQLWKEREAENISQISSKYQPLPNSSATLPPLPSGLDFYVLPPTQQTRAYFVVFITKCFQYELKNESLTDDRLFSKYVLNLISLCSKIWRIDFTTRAVSLYTAAHLSGYLKDSFTLMAGKDLGPINLQRTTTLFHFAKRIIEELGNLVWEDKETWLIKDQEAWAKNLAQTYNQLFFLIKNNLSIIFSKEVKPKFGPLLQFLGDYIESDTLFYKVDEMGIPKKWKTKLTKSLLRTVELRYADLFSNLPRDNTLSILHILDISDGIVEDVRFLQKKYKHPLLGFLKVKETAARLTTGMFASDSKNIFEHIQLDAKKRDLHLPYGDALEVYKSLHEIRSIYNQVALAKSAPPFQFDLESYFYPYLADWAAESNERFQRAIDEALNRDNFEAIDLSDDSKKFSSSVLDIFKLVKEYLNILKLLSWQNGYQISKIYTLLLKSISDGVLRYCNKITDKIFNDLNKDDAKLASQLENNEKRKSGNWFDEVKNVVSNMQSVKLESEGAYNFEPETCIALDNLSAMMEQLSKLEEYVDPETISQTIKKFDPKAQKKYISHVFSIRIVSAENVKTSLSSGTSVHPYLTIIDTQVKRTIAKTRVISNSDCPQWDEEFELTMEANSLKTLSLTIWDERYGTHSICGRALMQLEPRNFKHDGLPQDIYLDLDTLGRVHIEVAVESERVDAIFVMGRAHRALKSSQERCLKLIVQKFSSFINLCFSQTNLRSICGNVGNLKPTQDQIDESMVPLCGYLNDNLAVLAQYLSNHLLIDVMLATWDVVISSADTLLLPKLATAKIPNSTSALGKNINQVASGTTRWQSAVTSAMANVGNSIGISGSDRQLTHLEVETVFSWLNYLCVDFFHNNGNGPSLSKLKNEKYQGLLLLPVYYDHDTDYLKQEVERLSPAYIQSLRDKNNFEILSRKDSKGLGKAGTLIRNKTISANATVKARAQAAREQEEARSDPVSAQIDSEDIILRILILRGERVFVARRLEQREKLSHTIVTERLARAAAEGVFRK